MGEEKLAGVSIKGFQIIEQLMKDNRYIHDVLYPYYYNKIEIDRFHQNSLIYDTNSGTLVSESAQKRKEQQSLSPLEEDTTPTDDTTQTVDDIPPDGNNYPPNGKKKKPTNKKRKKKPP